MAQVNNWEAKRNHVNSLVAELQKKPESEKLAYPLNPAGILNAYREGDVLFETAVSQLREWAIKYAAQQTLHTDELCSCPPERRYKKIELCEKCGKRKPARR